MCYGSRKPKLDDYTDTDMTSDIDSRKSNSRHMMSFVKKQSKL